MIRKMEAWQSAQDRNGIIHHDGDGTVQTLQMDEVPIQLLLHHDTGANRSVTNDLSILNNVQSIPPYNIKGVNATEGFIQCTMKGILNIQCSDGSTIPVPTYHSEHVEGTIISPTELCMHNFINYPNFKQDCDVSSGTGTLSFYHPHVSRQANIDLVMKNGLWFSLQRKRKRIEHIDNQQGYVKTLTPEAEYEMWHQRLAHPGKKVMQYVSQCVDGIPELHKKRHQLYHCLCCDKAKIRKKDRNRIANTTHITSRAQRFHMDFGFVRGDQYKKYDKTLHRLSLIHI